MFNTVAVRFIGQASHNEKEYAYLTDIADLKEGDLVVVDSTNGFKTATITSLFANETAATKWVVCKVDIKAFKDKLADLKRKQFIFKQMKQRLERVNVIDQFKEAAKHDTEMAKLLEAFTTQPKLEELAE